VYRASKKLDIVIYSKFVWKGHVRMRNIRLRQNVIEYRLQVVGRCVGIREAPFTKL
jgi:hypothetical protein